LVEILVTVAIMGIAITGIFSALSTYLMLGSVQRSTANVDQVIRTYSESMVSASYVSCASSYASVTLPSGYSFSAGPTIDYWKGDSPATFSSTCASDKGVQRISATVREQSSGQSQQFVIAKNSG
jgi:type II secretory pathway pseudopilin PulG